MTASPERPIADDMALPPGKTCADCRNFQRCVAFIGPKHINDTQRRCDWSPSRFGPSTGEPAKEVA